jgi:hypothetical protein
MGYFTMTNQHLGGPAVFFILNPTQLVKMNKRRKESKENVVRCLAPNCRVIIFGRKSKRRLSNYWDL